MKRTLLLTGATGALGFPLLNDLLRNGNFDRIVALTRGDPAVLASTLQLETPNLDVSHLECFSVELGANETEHSLAGLPHDVTCIVHAAACTQFRAPIEQLTQANVNGTRQLLSWAETLPSAPRFIHLSTTCVAGARSGEIAETPLPDNSDFLNHYEHTKWQAEQLVLSSPLRPEIVRLATVIGDSRDGRVRRPGAFHTTLRWLHAGLLPIIPGNDATRLDLLPTDLAVEFFARLLLHPAQPGSIYHVSCGAHGVPLGELLAFATERFAACSDAWRAGHVLPPVLASRATFDEFRNTLLKTRDVLFTRVLESVDSFLPELFYPKTYSTARAEHIWGGPLPLPDWRTWISHVIDHALRGTVARESRLSSPS